MTVPTGKKWKLNSYVAKFVTDANAATRRLEITIRDDAGNLIMASNNLASGTNSATQIASKTRFYLLTTASKPLSTDPNWSSDTSDPEFVAFYLPYIDPSDMWLPQGWTITINAVNGLVGDIYTITATMREAEEGDDFQI